MEDLKVSNMSASASGTVGAARKKKVIRQKSGLNRSILDQGWFSFKTMLALQAGRKRRVAGIGSSEKYEQNSVRIADIFSAENRRTQAHFSCIKCGYKRKCRCR